MTKRILAVVGDYYHNQEIAKQSLEQAIQQVDEVCVEYTKVHMLVDELSSKPDAVILFAENRLNPQDAEVNTWMDMEAAKEITNYVNQGGIWIAWHSGLASYENITEYTSLLRGYFEHHPDKHQQVTYSMHYGSDYIQQGETFTILDEHYFVTCDEDNTNIFLTSKSIDGSSIAGWEHKVGSGHVFCITPAHNKEGLLHPAMTSLLANVLKIIA